MKHLAEFLTPPNAKYVKNHSCYIYKLILPDLLVHFRNNCTRMCGQRFLEEQGEGKNHSEKILKPKNQERSGVLFAWVLML